MAEATATSKGQITIPAEVRLKHQGKRVSVSEMRLRSVPALDTNVLLRYFVADDPRQTRVFVV